MKTNRMLRALCALMVMMVAMSGAGFALAADEAAVSKAVSPTSVTLDVTAQTVVPGQILQLTAEVEPADASQSVTWKSSKTSVATVSSNGKVTAKAKGTATITATTKKGGKKATCKITVSKKFDGVTVRFYGVGNSNYPGLKDKNLPGCKTDVDNMVSVYRSATFGGKSAIATPYYDLTGKEIEALFATMKDNATENDISVFYYSGHGLSDPEPAYHGALLGVDVANRGPDSAYVKVSTVQKALDQVPGHVIIILDSCFSGQFIKTKDGGAQSLQAAAKASNDAWISALSSSKATNYNAKSISEDSPVKNKYRLLTASSNAQESTMLIEKTGKNYGLFTWKLADKLKNMAADSNKDKVVSLKEAYTSVNKAVSSYKSAWNKVYPKNKIEQVTKVWPSSNNFPVYARN